MADKIWLGTTDTDWATAANWSPSGAPASSDNVRFVATYSNNIAGYNASAVNLADCVFEAGYSGTVGSATLDLSISCTYFEFSGEGAAYIDLSTTSVDPRVLATAVAPGTGEYGLYLIGTGIGTLSIEGGNTGLAAVHGQAATATTIRQHSGEVRVGSGATVTNYSGYAGSAVISTNLTTAKLFGATLTTGEQAAITTLTIEAGVCVSNASGTITTATVNGGTLDLSQAGISRTITTLNLNPGGGINYDPDAVTLSTISEADAPITITTSGI